MTTPTCEFDQFAADYEQCCQRGLDLSGEDKNYFAQGRISWMRSWLGKHDVAPPERVVDFGCGVGDVSSFLAEMIPTAKVIGVDVSRRCIEKAARQFSSDRVTFCHVDELEPGHDLVHCNGVIHHVLPANRPSVFQQMTSALRPGGLLLLYENNPLNVGTHLVMRRIPFDRDARMIWHRGVMGLCRRAGLVVRDVVFLFYFPRFAARLRPLEKYLMRLPFGAQYAVVAEKPNMQTG